MDATEKSWQAHIELLEDRIANFRLKTSKEIRELIAQHKQQKAALEYYSKNIKEE